MKIKNNCQVSTMEFWYDLTDGGYLNPDEILENPEDAKRARDSIAVIKDFENSCEEQIPGFIQ